MAAVGSSIGIGNIWRFPSLTWKYGGEVFVPTYIAVLIAIGIPMLVLELALGQKLQSGSMKAFGGISSRFAGVGFASSYAGFIVSTIYVVLLGLCLLFAAKTNAAGDDLPWAEDNLNRPTSCKTAANYQQGPAQIYFYLNATKVYMEDDCKPFDATKAGAESVFNNDLALWTGITWIIVFLGVVMGPKSIQIMTAITVPVKFIMLFICLGLYTEMAAAWKVNGTDYYFGASQWLLADGTPYDKRAALNQLYKDCYNMVFFSVGTCVGVFAAYGSYRKIRQPIISYAFAIGFLDFIFSLVASWIIWSGLAVLVTKGDDAAQQTSSSGLTFIAFPRLAEVAKNQQSYVAFCLLMWFSGIDSAVSYVMAHVENRKAQQPGMPYPVIALMECAIGVGMSLMFCTNWGWILFDLVDHYVSDYCIILLGLLQCVAVGWVFEADTTAAKTPMHHQALKVLGVCFWVPVVVISFYANFGFGEQKVIGVYVLVGILVMAMLASYGSSKMTFGLWYHEIFFAGVSKLSWSVTSISYPDEDIEMRKWWMPLFEAYFGLSIKYFNPALLTFMLFENLSNDLKSPYAEQPVVMQISASILIFFVLIAIIAPLFASDLPMEYNHDPNVEFIADEIHDWRLRTGVEAVKMRIEARTYANRPVAGAQPLAGGDVEMVPASDDKSGFSTQQYNT